MLLTVNSFTSFHVIEPEEVADEETLHSEWSHSANLENAIELAGYGKFHRLLLAVTGLIYATCAISTTTLSFVLPSAECDFDLSSANKGKLSAVPLIGMICGCGVWGSIADCQGRKIAIMCSLLVDFLAGSISSFVASFEIFMVCRFFNGFGIIGATSLVFTYLGEFLPKSRKDTVLGKLEIFWNIGVLILPGIAWMFLSNRFQQYFNFHQNFTPWRIFILICSLPSLISFILLYFLPESPKFLISAEKFDEARAIFRKIYECNTGKVISPYSAIIFRGECDINSLSFTKHPTTLFYRFRKKFDILLKMLKQLFSLCYLKYVIIISFADFGLMSSYYTLTMWFPEIFERFHNFEMNHPKSMARVCDISNYNTTESNAVFHTCDASIEDRVFLDAIIIALSCIPSSVLLGFSMKTFGKRTVLIIGLVLSGVTTLLLNVVQRTVEVLVISCVFEALTSVMEAVIFCIAVDLLPTNLRAIAVAIIATSGRLGAILGNITFGLLIDVYCVIPIYLFGLVLIVSGVLCLTLAKKGNYIAII